MIWGGSGKSGEKKLNGYLPGKKIQQQVGQEKKLNSRLAGKKNQRKFSARAPPSHIINGPSLTVTPRSICVRHYAGRKILDVSVAQPKTCHLRAGEGVCRALE